MLYEKRGITLWVECTRHKAVPRKTSLQFLSEHISLFTIILKAVPNIPLQSKHSVRIMLNEKRSLTVRVEFTRHRAIWQKASFWFLSEGISFTTYSQERSQTSSLRFHRKSDFKLLNPKNDLTLWDEYTHHMQLLTKLTRIDFLVHHWPLSST